MSCENSWNQNQVPLPLPCNPAPAVFNWKDMSISFLPSMLPRNEFSKHQDLHSQNHQVLETECSTIQRSFSATRHLPLREPVMIQGPRSQTNQLIINGSHRAENSNLSQHQPFSNKVKFSNFFPELTGQVPVSTSNMTPYFQRHQLSSERPQMIQDFHSVTDQLSANGSNIPQQSYPFIHQLPSNGICTNQNLKIYNQQLSTTTSCFSQIKCLPTHVLPQNEFSKSQIKYPPAHLQSDQDFIIRQGLNPSPHQQSERESIMRQGLQSIFGRRYEDGLGMVPYPHISEHQTLGSQSSYPLSTTFLEMGFNVNRKLSTSDAGSCQNSYPQYVEKVHICVVGPPRSGKADLIRTFARDDAIRIPTNKPLSRVVQQGMVSFGTTLKIDIWHGEDLTSAAEDLRSLCQSSKSVIMLVYRVAQNDTLLTVLEWIKSLKSDKGFNASIILIGNSTGVDSLFSSGGFPGMTPNLSELKDGIRAKEEYNLAAFYACSTKYVNEVDAVFLFAALKAFHRMV